MTQTLTGMDFSSDSTNDDFSFESSTTTAQLLLTKVLLHLHRPCSSLAFFPRSIPMIRRKHRIKIFQISSIIFLLLVSKHTIHGNHFELSQTQIPGFFQLFSGTTSPYWQVVTRFPIRHTSSLLSFLLLGKRAIQSYFRFSYKFVLRLIEIFVLPTQTCSGDSSHSFIRFSLELTWSSITC